MYTGGITKLDDVARRAVRGIDRLDVHDSAAPPAATAATASLVIVVWVMALVTVIVALAPRPTADEA